MKTPVLLSFLFLAALLPQAQGQQQEPDSPVFKNKPRPPEAPRVPESDALQQIWQAFQTARKAEAGDMFAQHELALRYIAGRGVERDTVRAALWFERAGAKGLTASRFNLAILAYHGWGTAWDPFRSYLLAKECAGAGMPEGEFLLAAFLTDGLATARNWPQAYVWAKKAADAGYAPAIESLPEFAARSSAAREAAPGAAAAAPPVFASLVPDSGASGTSPRLLRDVFRGGAELRSALGISKMLDDTTGVDSVGLEVVRRAARFGSPEALTVLGRCYEKGIEVRRDSVAAASMYVRAIRLDSPRAPALLAALLEQPAFASLLRQRSEREESEAAFVVAALTGLRLEAGVAEAKAASLMRRAADGGYLPAVVELGLWHYSGRLVSQDRSRARALWYQAAAAGSMEASIRLAVTALRDSTDPETHAAQIGMLRGAADEGSLLADVALGFCSENGIGVKRSKGDAARYYRAAAGRGSQDAFRALKRMYDELRPPDVEYRVEDQ